MALTNEVELWVPYGAPEQEPKRIIVHAMAEFVFDGNTTAPAWDFLRKLRLSAHSLITPTGVNVRQRKDHQGAYHAKGYNEDSLGIEFLVPGVHDYGTFLAAMKTDWLTAAAYQAGLEQILYWTDNYKITSIDTHYQLDPARKHDPGEGFPLERLLGDLLR